MTRGWALLAALVVAACANVPEPPLLSLGARLCDPAPVLEPATAVVFNRPRAAEVKIGAESRCLGPSPDGPRQTYVVFRLPDAPAPYSVTVQTVIAGQALVVPRVSILDAAGTRTRTVEPQEFRLKLLGFAAGLRVKQGDRYLVAMADTARLGEATVLRLSQRGPRGVQVAAGGPIFIPIYIPQDPPPQVNQLPAVFALNGVITVSAMAIDVVP